MSRWSRLVALVALAALAVTACGGEGDASDEDYVTGVCLAARTLNAGLEELDADPEAPPEQVLPLMAPIFRDWAGALDALEPPSDFKEFHDDLVDELRKASDAMEDWKPGGEDVFLALEEMQPPAGVAARLDEIAAKDAVCQEVGFRFSE